MYWTRLTYFCATCLLFLNSPNDYTMYSFLYSASWGAKQIKVKNGQTEQKIIQLQETPNNFMPNKILQI